MEIRLKHLRATRWFHWINFPLLVLMIWSGLMIYWAYPVYGIGSIRFFPAWFYSALRLNQRLADGMALHFFTETNTLSNAGVIAMFAAIESAAILLLGPGAISIDAKLFGRREIIVPHKKREGAGSTN